MRGDGAACTVYRLSEPLSSLNNKGWLASGVTSVYPCTHTHTHTLSLSHTHTHTHTHTPLVKGCFPSLCLLICSSTSFSSSSHPPFLLSVLLSLPSSPA